MILPPSAYYHHSLEFRRRGPVEDKCLIAKAALLVGRASSICTTEIELNALIISSEYNPQQFTDKQPTTPLGIWGLCKVLLWDITQKAWKIRCRAKLTWLYDIPSLLERVY